MDRSHHREPRAAATAVPSSDGGRQGRWRSVREVALVAGVLLVLTVAATWPLVLQLGSGVHDFGDPLLNAWTLAWVAHTLAVDPAQVFNANVFHPETGTLAFSETLIVPALMVAPVLWAGGDPILAHNVALIAGYVLSGVAMFVLVRSLTSHPGAALAASVAFTMHPYRIAHIGHVQLQMVFGVPLALWAIHRLRERPGARMGVVAGGLIAMQLYSCVYYAIFSLVPLSIVAIVMMWSAAPDLRWRVAGALLCALATSVVLSAPLLIAYRSAATVVGERTAEDVRTWSATPRDFLQAHPQSLAYGRELDPGRGERHLFPGLVAPVAAIAAIVPPASPIVAAYAVAGAASANFALGFNGAGYRVLYDTFRPLRAIRVPPRFAMMLALCLSVLAGLGVARLCRGRRRAAQWLIVAVVATGATVEGLSRPLELSVLPAPEPAVYRWLAREPPGVVCEYPVGPLEGRVGPQDPTYQYYSTRHWQRLVNGYSGFQPASYRALLEALAGFPDDRSIAYLRDERGVNILLVHSAYYIRGDFEADVRHLRARGDIAWVGRFAAPGGHHTEVFRLRP